MVKENTYRLVTIGVIIGAIILFAIVVFLNGGFGTGSERAAREAVTHFGTEMQNVSLLSPDASSTLASIYGPLVTPELLAEWQQNPEGAPGRLTSSPYPAGIEILSSTKQGTGYVITARVMLETNTGDAGEIPIVMYVTPRDGRWLIASYQEQIGTERATSSEQ